MPIVTLSLAATNYAVWYFTGTSVVGIFAGIAGYYWGSRDKDGSYKKNLKELAKEKEERFNQLTKAAQDFETYVHNIKTTISSNTTETQHSIDKTSETIDIASQQLEPTIESFNETLELIDSVCEKVPSELMPVVLLLKEKISGLETTHLSLQSVGCELNETVIDLNTQVEKHQLLTAQLEETNKNDKQTMATLRNTLRQTQSVLHELKIRHDDKINNLEKKLKKANADILQKQGEITDLLKGNSELINMIKQVQGGISVESIPPSERAPSHSVKMFS